MTPFSTAPQGAMKVANVIKDDVSTVQELQDALVSPDMYLLPLLYSALCAGMESGRLRAMEARTQQAALPDMISIAYEAHFRLELYQTCTMQGYRHSYSREALKDRAVFFKKMCKVVKTDRENNATQAWSTRQEALQMAGVYEADDMVEDATEHGGVDFDDDAF